jgi:hypothetical protein
MIVGVSRIRPADPAVVELIIPLLAVDQYRGSRLLVLNDNGDHATTAIPALA